MFFNFYTDVGCTITDVNNLLYKRRVEILQTIELLLESYEQLTDYVSDDLKQNIHYDV